jgi:hypothetical protein
MVCVTKAKSQQPLGKAARLPRQPRSTDVASEVGDVCELFLAEMRARRVRLRKLLQLVRIEVERLPATSAPVRSRKKCGS